MKQRMVTTKCEECGKEWQEKKTWHGQSAICTNCGKERDLKYRCKRHGGRDGINCFACEIEAKF